MKVTYNGMTGELVRLERKEYRTAYVQNLTIGACTANEISVHQPEPKVSYLYDLTICDGKKKATISFENVNLSDVKFSGCDVSFNG